MKTQALNFPDQCWFLQVAGQRRKGGAAFTQIRSSWDGERTRGGYDTSPTRTCSAGPTHKSSVLLFTVLCEIRSVFSRYLARLSNAIRAVSRDLSGPQGLGGSGSTGARPKYQDTCWKRGAWLVENGWRVFGHCFSFSNPPRFRGGACDVVHSPALLRTSAKPRICDCTGRQPIFCETAAAFTMSKAVNRCPRCHSDLLPLLA